MPEICFRNFGERDANFAALSSDAALATDGTSRRWDSADAEASEGMLDAGSGLIITFLSV